MGSEPQIFPLRLLNNRDLSPYRDTDSMLNKNNIIIIALEVSIWRQTTLSLVSLWQQVIANIDNSCYISGMSQSDNNMAVKYGQG